MTSFVDATINSGGQMTLMISSMSQAILSSSDPIDQNARVDEELSEILSRRLRERPDAPSTRDLRAAAQVLAWATDAIGQEVFGVEPGRPGRSWVPEFRGRVRHMTDEEAADLSPDGAPPADPRAEHLPFHDPRGLDHF